MNPKMLIFIKSAAILFLTLLFSVLGGYAYHSFGLSSHPDAYSATPEFLGASRFAIILVCFFASCVAGGLALAAEFLLKSKDEPKPGEKNIDELKEELARKKAESAKVIGQMEDIKNRVLSLSSLMVSLSNMAQVVGATLDIQEVIDLIMDNVVRNLKATKAALILVDPETKELELAAHYGWNAVEVQSFDMKPGEGIIGHVLEKHVLVDEEMCKSEPTVSQLVRQDPLKNKTYICAPLATKDSTVGVLQIESVEKDKNQKKERSSDEKRLVTILVSLGAMAISNARLFAKTQEWATIDALTGLNNRRRLLDFFDKEIKRADAENHPVAFFFSDIDHFKPFNDTYGHAIGDFVLTGVAQEYKKIVRKQDLAGRYGGEEFCLVCPATNKAEAREIAERLRKNVEAKKFNTEAGVLSVTISCGVASYPEDGKNSTEVMEASDEMLYVCKESGRNRVCVRGVDPINEIVKLKIAADKVKSSDPAKAEELLRQLAELQAKEKGEAPPSSSAPPAAAAPQQQRPPAPPGQQRPPQRPPMPPGQRPPAPPGQRPPAPPGQRPPAPPVQRPPAPPGQRPPAPPGQRPPAPPGQRPPAPPGQRPQQQRPPAPPGQRPPQQRPPAPPGQRPPQRPPAPPGQRPPATPGLRPPPKS
jgi:diguanylate cyclase (GGDEF)-like protein